MDTKGLEAIKRIGQWGGAAIFYGNFAVWMWGLLTVPDKNVFVDMIGSIVSLHSLYLGAAVGSAILALGCSWSGILWAIGVYRRWENKRIRNSPSGKFRRLHNVVVREFNLIEQDRAYEHDGASTRSQASKCAQREILRFELSQCGLATPDPETDGDGVWCEFISRLMPLSQHGRIEEARTLGATFDKRKGQS